MSSKTLLPHLVNEGLTASKSFQSLPLRYRLTVTFYASILIGFLTAVAAVAGLLYPDQLYQTAELQELAARQQAGAIHRITDFQIELVAFDDTDKDDRQQEKPPHPGDLFPDDAKNLHHN